MPMPSTTKSKSNKPLTPKEAMAELEKIQTNYKKKISQINETREKKITALISKIDNRKIKEIEDSIKNL